MQKPLLQSYDWHARFIAQEIWTRPIREYIFAQLSLPNEPKVLEVGSGTGAIISKNPWSTKYLYGIDLDSSHLRLCQKEFPNISLNHGDGNRLPFAKNVFDIVFCHFLLLWVDDPVQIVREMSRVAKSGGYVMIFAEPDYEGRIDYPSSLEKLGSAQTEALRLQGADPATGRKLKEIAKQAGLHEYHAGILGNESGESFSLPYWESEWQMYKHDLGTILSEDVLAMFKETDLKAYEQGIRTQFIPTFYLWVKNT